MEAQAARPVNLHLSQQSLKGTEITNRYYAGGLQYEQKFVQQRVVKDWSFSTTAEGWVAAYHISGFTWASPGHVQGNFTGIDPYLRSSVVSVPIHKNMAVRLRMRVSAQGQQRAQLFFTTTTETGESEAKSVVFSLVPDGNNFYEYLVPMGGVATWAATGIRVQFPWLT